MDTQNRSKTSRATEIPLFPIVGAVGHSGIYTERLINQLKGCGLTISEGVMFPFNAGLKDKPLPVYTGTVVGSTEIFPSFNGLNYKPEDRVISSTSDDIKNVESSSSGNSSSASKEDLPLEGYFYYPVLYKYLRSLENCQKCDFKMFLRIWVPRDGINLQGYDISQEALYNNLWKLLILNFSEDYIEKYHNISPDTVSGYWLFDEPSIPWFSTIAYVNDKIIKPYSSKPATATLLSNYAKIYNLFGTPKDPSEDFTSDSLFLTYLKEYQRQVNTPIWNGDFYPFSTVQAPGNTAMLGYIPLHWLYFDYLLINLTTSKLNGKPYWGFVQASEEGSDLTPATTESDKPLYRYRTGKNQLQFQAFCNLAFGAQGIIYWSMITPDGYEFAPLKPKEDGEDDEYVETETYNDIKEINEQIQAYRHVFLGSSVEATCCTNIQVSDSADNAFRVLAPWTGSFYPVESINVVTPGESMPRFLFSRIQDKNGGKYLVIMNLETLKRNFNTPEERSLLIQFSTMMKDVTPLAPLATDVNAAVKVELMATSGAKSSENEENEQYAAFPRSYEASTTYKITLPAGGWKLLKIF